MARENVPVLQEYTYTPYTRQELVAPELPWSSRDKPIPAAPPNYSSLAPLGNWGKTQLKKLGFRQINGNKNPHGKEKKKKERNWVSLWLSKGTDLEN